MPLLSSDLFCLNQILSVVPLTDFNMVKELTKIKTENWNILDVYRKPNFSRQMLIKDPGTANQGFNYRHHPYSKTVPFLACHIDWLSLSSSSPREQNVYDQPDKLMFQNCCLYLWRDVDVFEPISSLYSDTANVLQWPAANLKSPQDSKAESTTTNRPASDLQQDPTDRAGFESNRQNTCWQ